MPPLDVVEEDFKTYFAEPRASEKRKAVTA
jgi:hypothetical protein